MSSMPTLHVRWILKDSSCPVAGAAREVAGAEVREVAGEVCRETDRVDN